MDCILLECLEYLHYCHYNHDENILTHAVDEYYLSAVRDERIEEGDISVIEFLVKNGVSLDNENYEGETAVMRAEHYGLNNVRNYLKNVQEERTKHELISGVDKKSRLQKPLKIKKRPNIGGKK